MLVNDVVVGIDYESVREQHPTEIFTKVFTFNSARKSMSTVVPLPGGGYRLFTKGASEIVLEKCTGIMKDGGNVVSLSPADHRQIVSSVVKPMAGRALRTIALAYRLVPHAWTFCLSTSHDLFLHGNAETFHQQWIGMRRKQW